jgi:hypothetical protein
VNNYNFTPPPNPSADAIQAANALIAIAADPAGAKQRLDALTATHAQITAAHDELQAERRRLIDENNRAADLRARENVVANKEADLEKSAIAQAVATSAIADREHKVSVAESALKAKQEAHEANVAALNQRLANMRSALS